eukprot:g3002.t1
MVRFRFFRGSTKERRSNVNPIDEREYNPLEGHEKYQRVSNLNSGTFGFVLKAIDCTTKQPVAIKLLPRGSRIHNAVEREILNHKSLTHPHVIQFKEVFLNDKYLAIVMEYANQGDLFRFIQTQGRMREDLARWIFQQLIFGLDYCHRRGIANRDIKLENILLQSGARRPLVKLCDFGYSKHEEWDSAPKSRVGTPDYMSPEILHSRGGYDAKKADLWSCGVVLYVIVTGQYPFSRKEDERLTVDAQHHLVLQRVLEARYHLPPFLTNDCKNLMQRLLDPNPDTRISIPEIIKHPWHKIGLPPEAENMNDVYLTVVRRSVQADECIRTMVKTATNIPGKELVSDQIIDWAMGEEDYFNADSSKESIDEDRLNTTHST